MLNLAHMYADRPDGLARQIEDKIEAAVAEERERIFDAIDNIEIGRIFSTCRQRDLAELIDDIAADVGADHRVVKLLLELHRDMKSNQDEVDVAIEELKEKP